MWQGSTDGLTPFGSVAATADRYCKAGATLVFRGYPIAEHMTNAIVGTARSVPVSQGSLRRSARTHGLLNSVLRRRNKSYIPFLGICPRILLDGRSASPNSPSEDECVVRDHRMSVRSTFVAADVPPCARRLAGTAARRAAIACRFRCRPIPPIQGRHQPRLRTRRQLLHLASETNPGSSRATATDTASPTPPAPPSSGCRPRNWADSCSSVRHRPDRGRVGSGVRLTAGHPRHRLDTDVHRRRLQPRHRPRTGSSWLRPSRRAHVHAPHPARIRGGTLPARTCDGCADFRRWRSAPAECPHHSLQVRCAGSSTRTCT